MRKNSIVEHQNTCSVPDKSETVMRTGVKRQYGANDDRSVFVGENKVKNNSELELTNNPKQQSNATSHIDGRLETNTIDEENFTLK